MKKNRKKGPGGLIRKKKLKKNFAHVPKKNC